MVDNQYLQAILDVADLFRLKMPENSHYLHYLNDLITPKGLVIKYAEILEKHVFEKIK